MSLVLREPENYVTASPATPYHEWHPPVKEWSPQVENQVQFGMSDAKLAQLGPVGGVVPKGFSTT